MTDNNNNLTIGHYAFHRNTGNANHVKHGPVAFEANKDMDYTPKLEPGRKYKPSELELRIREEVLENIEALMDELYENGLYNREYHIELLTKVRDRLNLLWGE